MGRWRIEVAAQGHPAEEQSDYSGSDTRYPPKQEAAVLSAIKVLPDTAPDLQFGHIAIESVPVIVNELFKLIAVHSLLVLKRALPALPCDEKCGTPREHF